MNINSQGLAWTWTIHLLLKCLIIHSIWFYPNPWKLIFYFAVYPLLSELQYLIMASSISLYVSPIQCSTSSLTPFTLPLILNTQQPQHTFLITENSFQFKVVFLFPLHALEHFFLLVWGISYLWDGWVSLHLNFLVLGKNLCQSFTFLA